MGFFWILHSAWVWYKCFTTLKFFPYMSDLICFRVSLHDCTYSGIICLLHSLGVLQLQSLYSCIYSPSISMGCSCLFSDSNKDKSNTQAGSFRGSLLQQWGAPALWGCGTAVVQEQFCLERHSAVIFNVHWRFSSVDVKCLYFSLELWIYQVCSTQITELFGNQLFDSEMRNKEAGIPVSLQSTGLEMWPP